MVSAPSNAASLKLELWSARSGGWVAFDDVSLESKPLGSGRYYYFGNQRVAMVENSQLKYLHTDHLGSTYLVTNNEGNLVDSAPRYAAYGRERIPGSISALPTEYGFTGQRQDNRTGLVYMNARYYDPDLGIFISPDTIIPDPTNVMDYNRYMFVRGNPMKYNDPSGHFVETVWDAVNVGMGVASLGYNLWNGNYSDAAWDAGGLVVDLAATAIPIIPGGAATALKLGRAADAVVSVASHADEVMDVAKFANKADDAGDLAKQLDNLPTSGGETPDYVYRALAKGEDPSTGLVARLPDAGNSPLSHVAGKRNSQWISTTADKNVALNKYDTGNGVVRIDMSQVSSEIADLRGGIANGGRFSYYARADQEILIKNFLPANAIERIK